jgi:hypothetical protein
MESRNSFEPSLSTGLESLNRFDDTVAFTDPLALEEPLFPPDWDQESPPYDGGLYSTPLNWDPPQVETQDPQAPSYPTMNGLTLAQQEKLRNIAMPEHLHYRSQPSHPPMTIVKAANASRLPMQTMTTMKIHLASIHL